MARFRTAPDQVVERVVDAARAMELASPRAFALLVGEASRNRRDSATA